MYDPSLIERRIIRIRCEKYPEQSRQFMEMKQILHMKEGEGDKSYTENSSMQNKVQATAKAVVQQAVLDFYLSSYGEKESKDNNGNKTKNVIRIADLGCAFGPNAWKVVTDVVNTVVTKCHELDLCLPEFQIFLNDLPSNDFNGLFRSLPEALLHEQVLCYIAGVPGSFYERLFPNGSVDFFHSSSSIHWLSQVPMELQGEEGARQNNDNIFISQSSPQVVIDAYHTQFQRDFDKFLHCRSEEVVANGQMVLMWMGRRVTDAAAEEYLIFWDLLAQALNDMVVEGLVEKDKVITFNLPFYPPTAKEVLNVVERDGSFSIKFMDFFDVDMAIYPKEKTTCNELINNENHSRSRNIAGHLRAALESLMVSLVGKDLIDDLFTRYEKIIHEYYLLKDPTFVYLIVSLKRNV